MHWNDKGWKLILSYLFLRFHDFFEFSVHYCLDFMVNLNNVMIILRRSMWFCDIAWIYMPVIIDITPRMRSNPFLFIAIIFWALASGLFAISIWTPRWRSAGQPMGSSYNLLIKCSASALCTSLGKYGSHTWKLCALEVDTQYVFY